MRPRANPEAPPGRPRREMAGQWANASSGGRSSTLGAKPRAWPHTRRPCCVRGQRGGPWDSRSGPGLSPARPPRPSPEGGPRGGCGRHATGHAPPFPWFTSIQRLSLHSLHWAVPGPPPERGALSIRAPCESQTRLGSLCCGPWACGTHFALRAWIGPGGGWLALLASIAEAGLSIQRSFVGPVGPHELDGRVFFQLHGGALRRSC